MKAFLKDAAAFLALTVFLFNALQYAGLIAAAAHPMMGG